MYDTSILEPQEQRAVVENPERLLARDDLTDTQKIEVLRALCHDERLRAIADAEGMGGGRPPRLKRLKKALARLDDG